MPVIFQSKRETLLNTAAHPRVVAARIPVQVTSLDRAYTKLMLGKKATRDAKKLKR